MQTLAVLCNTRSWGGLEMNVCKLAKWLYEEEHCKVEVYCPTKSPAAEWLAASAPGVQQISFESKRKYADLAAVLRLKKLLKTGQVKALLSSHSKDINLMVLANLWPGHKLGVFYLQQMEIGIDKKDFFHTFFYRRLKGWIAPLPSSAKNTLARTRVPESRISILPLCMELATFLDDKTNKKEARYFFKLPQDIYLVGIVGRIDKGKGQEFLIEAAARLRQKAIDVHILLLGEETRGEEGAYLPYLKELIQRHDLEGRVFFRPFTQRTDLAYKALDVFVMASLSETYGMVTIEAMASQLAVVGTKAGGTTELIEHQKTGILVPPANAEALADALQFLKENPEESRKIAEEARKFTIKEFDHKRQSREIAKMMKGSQSD